MTTVTVEGHEVVIKNECTTEDTNENIHEVIQNDTDVSQQDVHPEFKPKERKKVFDVYMNDCYNNAYGDYNGGYDPPSMFGYNFMRPPQNFGPPPPMFHSGPRGPPGPPGPQGPSPFWWGRGFGPKGPPILRQPMDDRTVRYLKRCGVGKEHLKNLPRDLLQLIEPEYCGLCAQSLETFAISRVHYISKNHLKNQKKWLNQKSEVGFRRSKEIALKARELYCELCDVHITSKSHSDSHYAGKTHRAIVEGRKNPKNPFLLQSGMESRVTHLIRREKKHLKVVSAEVVPEKEARTFNSELHCEICKTSVTCSEQMTMHLNGKRHLSKEKQHILKMMQGSGNETADDTSKKIKKEEKDKDSETDNYDWGTGSSAWDETKTDNVY